MRRTALLTLSVVVVAFVAVACVPPPPPPPPFQCPSSPVAAPTAPSPSVTKTLVTALPGAITMTTRGSDTALYVGTQSGHVFSVTGGTATDRLDLSGLVASGGERGLLGMTFSPSGDKLYVHYSAAGTGATTVAEYTAAPAPAAPGMFTSPRIVLTNDHSAAGNHNGGSLLFGNDGMLYLALGDGGGANDAGGGQVAGGNGQSLNTLQGKILRIDPTDPPAAGTGLNLSYTAPAGNPFAGVPGLDEIWSYGLRNPFRMSFDRTTHDLWVGDVGQGAREEVDFVAATDATHPGGKKANFGWNRCEGMIGGPNGSAPDGSGGAVLAPIFDIAHGSGDCAIIGGYVYRGSAIAGLAGQYLYTDNCNGAIRALAPAGGGAVTNRNLGQVVSSPSSFGEDNSGELYVLSLSQGLFRIDHL